MNIAGLDLNLLIAFESLLDERHVGRAANRVGLSQPAFSNAISRLRSRLADPLFVRTNGSMIPTKRAEQLSGPIRQALATLRDTLETPAIFDPKVSSLQFRIGLSDDIELRLVPQFAQFMQGRNLLLQTRRLDGLFAVPEAQLRVGTLDLAIGYFPDARSLAPTFAMETLGSERNVVIAGRGHPAFARKMTLKRLAELDHAAVIYRSEPCGLIDRELSSRGLKRKLSLALPHCLSVLHAVASSDLVACVQESVAQKYAAALNLELHAEPIGLPPFVVRMVWRQQRRYDPAQIWLRSSIQSAYSDAQS